MSEQKTILLTGAAGFIGFHTAKALLERGDKVIGIDNLNDYYDPSLKTSRLEILTKHPDFVFHRQNIEDPLQIEQARIDAICHLAAQAGVRYSIENPLTYEKSNMLGTLNILEFARNNSIRSVVFASSSSVYGNSKQVPFKETEKLDEPISLYAATKKANELYFHVYNHLFNINSVGLRFFTVYGPWGRPDMAYFKFTKSILENKPIDVYNNGEMKRDFTYVDDIVSGVVASIDLVTSKTRNNDNIYEIMNLGRGEPVNLMDFISEIENSTGRHAIRQMKPMQQGDVNQTYSDTTKAKALLGYEPKTSIRQGISRFVEWYKEYYGVIL
jgi:UDP-glucuronate 4-epimerase